MDVITGGARRRDTRLVPLLALFGLLLAAALAAVYIGSQPRPPADPLLADAPSASPRAPIATPALQRYADLVLSMPYPIRQVQPGNLVGIAGPDTNELLRSIHRVDTQTDSTSVVVDDIPVAPTDHVSFATWGNTILIGHDEGSRALRYDARTGELLGETPVGTRPLEPLVAGGAIWFPNFGDGSITGIDPLTGSVIATIPIPQFNGQGPLALGVGDDSTSLWAVSPSSSSLIGINPGSGSVAIDATLPGESYCGVGGLSHKYWVIGCDGSVVVLPDTYVSSSEPVTINVAPGVIAPVFEHAGRVWFPTEDRSTPDWTTTLVPVDAESLAVGDPVDLGAKVGVVRTGEIVWLMSGKELYRLRLDDLPTN